jgi:negative regulator of replication initiation
MKVLSAKIQDEIYDQFVQKATQEGRSQSELLRSLILSSVKAGAQSFKDTVFVARESIKVLESIEKMMDDVVSAAKPKILEYVKRQRLEFEKLLPSANR